MPYINLQTFEANFDQIYCYEEAINLNIYFYKIKLPDLKS